MNTPRPEDILAELVRIRLAKGIRQQDVAEAMNIGQPSVSELERGLTSPKLSTLIKYATAVGATLELGVTLDDGPTDGSSLGSVA